ncbi:MAG TPA: cell division protein FtsB [Gammaproteobacteria bacterium]|nr:cell division protein FtsB [Gammaproteobacteria bacterium]
MKTLIALLVLVFGAVQFQLWVGAGSVMDVWHLHRAVEEQRAENTALRERNQALAAEVQSLKQDSAAVEERARLELGMVKEGETFFRIVER